VFHKILFFGLFCAERKIFSNCLDVKLIQGASGKRLNACYSLNLCNKFPQIQYIIQQSPYLKHLVYQELSIRLPVSPAQSPIDDIEGANLGRDSQKMLVGD
jgi:hypothetical protein